MPLRCPLSQAEPHAVTAYAYDVIDAAGESQGVGGVDIDVHSPVCLEWRLGLNGREGVCDALVDLTEKNEALGNAGLCRPTQLIVPDSLRDVERLPAEADDLAIVTAAQCQVGERG